MAELTDEEVIDAMQGADRRMTYVVAYILRETHKHHKGTLGTDKVLRRLKALEKRDVVQRVRSDYAVQLCWRLTPSNVELSGPTAALSPEGPAQTQGSASD